MPNIKSIQLKTKELLTYFCSYHGSLVTIVTRHVADAYCPKEAPCQIWSQYDLRQRSYKAGKLMSLFQLAKHHGTTSCYRKYLLLSGLPLVIENTSCYRDHLFLSEGPLVIESTSCYRDHLFLSEGPLVIESTSCYRDHLFLSEGPLVIESTSCYRDHLFLSEGPLVIESTSCYRDFLLLSKVPLVIGSTSRYRKAFLSGRERHTSRLRIWRFLFDG